MSHRLSMDREAVESMQRTLSSGEPGIFAGYGLIGAIATLGGGGLVADQYLGTKPWCLLGGLAAGLVVGFYQLSRILKR